VNLAKVIVAGSESTLRSVLKSKELIIRGHFGTGHRG
jgi:hypothetical protein